MKELRAVWFIPIAFMIIQQVWIVHTYQEKNVFAGEMVMLECPFDSLPAKWVYWRKDNKTIYSLNVGLQGESSTWSNDTARYEGTSQAKYLTIKDLRQTDSGVYGCKVLIQNTMSSSLDVLDSPGLVRLSVSEQFIVMALTTPSVPYDTSEKIGLPTSSAKKEDRLELLSLLLLPILIAIGVIMYCKRSRIQELINGGCMAARRRRAHKIPSSDSHVDFEGAEDVPLGIIDGKQTPVSTQSSKATEFQLPLVGKVLMIDVHRAENEDAILQRLLKVVHCHVQITGEHKPPTGGKYLRSLGKFAHDRYPDQRIADHTLQIVAYVLHELDKIPDGRWKDRCEVLLTMPENQQQDKSTFYSKSIHDSIQVVSENDSNDDNPELHWLLCERMKLWISNPIKRKCIRYFIPREILYADDPTENIVTESSIDFQMSVSSLGDEGFCGSNTYQDDIVDTAEIEDLVEFWISKIRKLNSTHQKRILEKLYQPIPGKEDSMTQEALSNMTQEALSNMIQEALSNMSQGALSNMSQGALSNMIQGVVSNMIQEALLNDTYEKAAKLIEKKRTKCISEANKKPDADAYHSNLNDGESSNDSEQEKKKTKSIHKPNEEPEPLCRIANVGASMSSKDNGREMEKDDDEIKDLTKINDTIFLNLSSKSN